jgi:hypothetical protein
MPTATEVQKSIVVEPKVYELPSAELHTALITKVEDLGIVESELYGNQHKVKIHYKITDEKSSKGEDLFVFETCSVSLGEKARLGKRLRALGVDTDGKVDLAEIVGFQVNAGVIHNKKGEKTYANIDFVSRIKGTAQTKKNVATPVVEEV